MSKVFKHEIVKFHTGSPYAPWNQSMGQEDPSIYIEGKPSMFYREKPSENGNGWWAGNKLVHQYATQKEVAEVLATARRRLEDRIRKDPEALGKALDAVFFMYF